MKYPDIPWTDVPAAELPPGVLMLRERRLPAHGGYLVVEKQVQLLPPAAPIDPRVDL